MAQTILPFGTAPTGAEAHIHLLSNVHGVTVGVCDLGANLVRCHVPDGRGSFPDVLLGHSGAAGYVGDRSYLGATVGRNANRIAKAQFEVAGTSYRLEANDGPHNLHGGPHRWSERLWRVVDEDDLSVTFELTSRKGDQGFPGSVQTHVTYRLSDDDQLTIFYSAVPSEPTIINLTNHAYWNLNGHASGNVLGHTLQVEATHYTPLEGQIPTGEVRAVEGTPYDLRSARTLAEVTEQLPQGLDDNFCLDNGGRVAPVAHLVGERTGITLEVLTDAPGLQVYAAAAFEEPDGKDGVSYGGFAGVALETQFFPDAIHHKHFEQPVFTPMRPFVRTTVFAFGTTEG